MNKSTTKNFLILAMSTLVLFSCSKDDDSTSTNPNDPGNPNNPANQKCRVTNASEDGGDEESIYEYDSQRRLTKVIYKENGQLESYFETFEYNNEGYISKSVEWDGSTMDGYDLYTYNGDGRLTKRESFYDNGSGIVKQSINTYEYDGNKRLIRKNRYNASAPTVIESYELYTYPSGNTARQTSYYDNDSDGTPDLDSTTDYTFDDKNSPQLLLGVAYDDEYVSEHNTLTEVYTRAGGTGTPDTYTFSYEYNAQGFPTKMTADYGGTSPEIVNISYNCN
jgi:hypothetical protein